MEEGDTKLAVEHFSALIDHAPDFAEGYNARATAFFLRGQYGLSLNDIQETLARNPRHFGAIGGLALILEELGRPEDALAAWRLLRRHLVPGHMYDLFSQASVQVVFCSWLHHQRQVHSVLVVVVESLS